MKGGTMSRSEKDLDRLEALLFELPQETFPMSLSELDGYITGLLTCPEMIPPSQWLPLVWGEAREAGFADLEAAQETIDAVMAHYNAVARAITSKGWLEPIYEVDPNSDETLWEPWIDGFTSAQSLRPDAWSTLFDKADKETQSCLQFFMALYDIYTGEHSFDDDALAEIDESAPDIIPNCVATILKSSRPEIFGGQGGTVVSLKDNVVPFTKTKTGRNDPCPCGSGRKYKFCCGAY